MKNLKNKDYAIILYNLYKNNFNRVSPIVSIPTEVSEEQKKKYEFCGPLCEEVWAYENKLIFISDEGPLKNVDRARKWPVNKHTFFIGVFLPLYQIRRNVEKPYVLNDVVEEFVLETGICKELFENGQEMKKWFSSATEISVEDAEKIVESFQKYWEENVTNNKLAP